VGGTHCIDLRDAGVVRNNKIDELRDELLGRRLADQEPNMIKCVGCPGEQDQETDEDSSDGIGVPCNSATDDRHGQTECVDYNVISMVDEEDVDRRIPAEYEAVNAEGALGEDWHI
jgi:hypothetical protein